MKSSLRAPFRITLREMNTADITSVLPIERVSLNFKWLPAKFQKCLDYQYPGIVAEHAGLVVGFLIYKVCITHLTILNCAVRPFFRRKKVGAQMVDEVIRQLSQYRRTIDIVVRETNLGGQLFLREQGFRATGSILRQYFRHDGEDAYAMQYHW